MELGQMCFGNPTGQHEMLPYQDALVRDVLREVERVFWNLNQRQFDLASGDTLPGLELRPYYWGTDEDKQALSNLKIGEQEIRWYKHPMRGSTCTLEWGPEQWVRWFDFAMAFIQRIEQTAAKVRV